MTVLRAAAFESAPCGGPRRRKQARVATCSEEVGVFGSTATPPRAAAGPCRKVALLAHVARTSKEAVLAKKFKLFDAHVGDCSCEVRAAMLFELLHPDHYEGVAGDLQQRADELCLMHAAMELASGERAVELWKGIIEYFDDLTGSLKLLMCLRLLNCTTGDFIDKSGSFNTCVDERRLVRDFGVPVRFALSVVHRAQRYVSAVSCSYLEVATGAFCGPAAAAVVAAARREDSFKRHVLPCFLQFYMLVCVEPCVVLELSQPQAEPLRLVFAFRGGEARQVGHATSPAVVVHGVLQPQLVSAPRDEVAAAIEGVGLPRLLLSFAAHHPQFVGTPPDTPPDLEGSCRQQGGDALAPEVLAAARRLDSEWAVYEELPRSSWPFTVVHVLAG